MSGKKKTVGLMTALFLLSASLGGCSDRVVDYGLETEQEAGELSNKLSQFSGEGNWTDEWQITTESGDSFSFVVDAEVIVPDADTMSVVEVETVPVDGEFIKTVAENFFGGSTVYYHDTEHLPGSELEQLIAELETRIAENEADLASIMEAAQAEGDQGSYQESIDIVQEELDEQRATLEYYQELLPEAPDHYVEAEDYSNCREYLGYLDEEPYVLRVEEDGGGAWYGEVELSVWPVDDNIMAPEEILERSSYISYTSMDKEPGVNQCSMSMEEAQALAERFLTQIGLSNQICTVAADMVWEGSAQTTAGETREKLYVTDGYVFNYRAGVEENVPLAGFGSNTEYYLEDVGAGGSPANGNRTANDRVIVQVYDEGIMMIDITDPVTVKQVTGGVKLLPLSSVREMIKKELQEHADCYDLENREVNNVLELNYIRVKDEGQENSYSYVPAWMLCARYDDVSYHPVFVNAIDGSVIYYEDTL